MLQYVKGVDNLAGMVVDGGIILKWAWSTWSAGVAWAYPARSRLQWCMLMKMIMNLRVPYKDGNSWPADRLSSPLKGLLSMQWHFTTLPIQIQWNTYILVLFAQGCLTPVTTHARKWNVGYLVPSNAPQEARRCLQPYDAINHLIHQLTL